MRALELGTNTCRKNKTLIFDRCLYTVNTNQFDRRWKKASREQTDIDRHKNSIHSCCNTDIAWALKVCNLSPSLNDSLLGDRRVFKK